MTEDDPNAGSGWGPEDEGADEWASGQWDIDDIADPEPVDGDGDDNLFDDEPYEDEPAAGGWWASLSGGGRAGLIAAAVVAIAALIAGAVMIFGGDDTKVAAPTSTQGTTPTTTTIAITTTTEPDSGPVAPLTGLRLADAAAATRPAIAIKIDNLDLPRESALPQAGLPKADIVFEPMVEGSITRFIAVFHSQDPGNKVGPVRSARTTDIQLLPQLGRTLFSWSGGNDGVVEAVRTAPSLVDVGHGAVPGAYRRINDGGRKLEHTLYVDAGSLWGRAPADMKAPDPLFQYRGPLDAPPPTAEAASGLRINWGGGGGSAPTAWDWDSALKLYKRSQRGRPHLDESGVQLGAMNVVVLVTDYGQSAADTRSPEAISVGSGEALVFTNGVLVRGRWDRPDLAKPATLVDNAGQVIKLTPGQTWVELAPAGTTTVA